MYPIYYSIKDTPSMKAINPAPFILIKLSTLQIMSRYKWMFVNDVKHLVVARK